MASRARSAQLQRYRAKRDFGRTPEPSGAARRSARKLEFVIQRHHARRLHYDFRLEWNGVLKSWAVPKGPSLDPAEKRLAVEVEDHPFEYRTFSGEIPAGAYGAGQVLLWDRGSWEPDGDVDQGLAKGKLVFTLDGERLHGRWSLVRLAKAEGGKQNWLLIKGRDEHAARAANGLDVTELYATGLGKERKSTRPVTAPAFIAPQLATAVDAVPTTGDWLTELKFDGYRIVAHVDRKRAHCFTRSGHDWSERMPAVVDALAGLDLQDSLLDGELIAVDERGMPQFQRLQQALDPGSGEAPVFMVFDAMRLLGADLRDKPQRERKRLLQQALASLPRAGSVRLVDFVDGESEALRAQACEQGFEGVILKQTEAAYQSGRNRAWLKLKCRREQEFVIGGYTRTAAGRKTLTALLLGYYDQGGTLQFAGRAGTGFSDEQLTVLRRRLDDLGVAQAPFAQEPGLRRTERPQWVEPELVAQVRFAEWTESGILRQPLFLGLREDIAAASVRREPDRIVPPPHSVVLAKSRTKTKARAQGKSTLARRAKVAAVSPSTSASQRKPGAPATPTHPWLTHPERVLYPTDGVTKRQLADYYESVAPVLWPHLQKRPLSVIRATSAQGRVFFQRHLDGDIPGLTPVSIPGSDDEPYFACSSLESIPRLAQIGAVELHTWGSRSPRAERADRVTFDLDPDPTLPWKPVREAATLVRGLLQELGLQCLLKTTGGQGLHLVVPLVRGPPFEVAAAFSRRVAEHLAHLIPERFSAKRGASNRKGRIYVDWQRNQLAATTVAAYSPRQRPGVPVSLPIDWDELGRDDIRAAHFNLRNVAARVVAQGDAWQKREIAPQALTQRVIARLERAGQ